MIRLNKYIASIDVASRRGADKLIKEGHVFVNGNIEMNPAYEIQEVDVVTFDFDIEKHKKSFTTVKLYKPKGYVVSTNPDEGKPIYELVKDLDKIQPVGRLDKDSSGLIIMTNDGVIHKKVIGSDTKVEKEYFVQVYEDLPDAALKKLKHGLSLDGVRLKEAEVKRINNNSFYITLREGRNRQIRRMARLIGCNVKVLTRVRIGSITIDNMTEGKYKRLTKKEMASLHV